MKLVVFSDIHISNYKRFDKKGSRLENCLDCLEEIVNVECDLVLFTGDLFNKHKGEDIYTLISTMEIIENCNNQCLVISGNHDMQNKNLNGDFISHHNIFDFNEGTNWKLIDNNRFTKDGCTFVGVPYYHDSKAMHKIFEKVKVVSNKKNYLLLHCTPSQIDNEFIRPDVDLSDPWYDQWDYIFCGHIHKHQQLTRNAVMVGSPLHRDRSDIGEQKGYIIFDTDTNTFERVFTEYPEFIDVIEFDPAYDEDYVTVTTPPEKLKITAPKIKASQRPSEIVEQFVKLKGGEDVHIQIANQYL